MYWITRLGMSNLLWICWLYQTLPEVFTFPVSPSNITDSTESKLWSPQLHYILGSIAVVAMVSAFLGCLCCRRERRAKGFQEFKDGSTAGSETIIERGLELEVSRSNNSTNQFQFEPLTVERFVPETKNLSGKPSKPPSPSLINDSLDKDENNLSPCQEWFSPGLHVPRERLKYLREIGRGWFGKVVEGTQDLDPGGLLPKNDGVVVRILTEEASTSERAWFLGEALPYLKLRHQSLLKLLGVCLETDPYLLLFESCSGGDLKTFLKSNSHSNETLIKTNVPIKMAIDIAVALDHMHRHGFAHTDLSARNCLVASDLSAKLGDYGIGVEKYPGDYYVVGDRALPIRWSAPESLVCTDTTIETRAITPLANLWSFAILLWEIGSWGDRPYDDLGDDQVIEMILSCRFYDHLPFKNLKESPDNLLEAIKSCWKLEPKERSSLDEVIEILKGKNFDFDQRWETLKPNSKEPMRSLSLKELRQSTDSDLWQADEKIFSTPQASFKLGPGEPIRNAPLAKTDTTESGSETEEESWRGRVERGAYTEKVRQKSKSVADLMVLVHIDSDSEAEWSLGPQVIEKPRKKLASGSVGDLRTTALADEFDEALKKLRNPNSNKIFKELPDKIQESFEESKSTESTSMPKNDSTSPNNFVDVELWKNALEFDLERKVTGFDLESIDFEKLIGDKCESRSVSDALESSTSAPNTPQSRGEDLSVDNEDFSNSEEVETERRRLPDADEEEDRKHLSTPDDERSSDSGFRDKESCEEEENPIPCSLSHSGLNSYGALFNTPLSASTEEEQLKVLLELDNILDAEDCKSLGEDISLSPSKINFNILEEDSIISALKSQLDSPVRDSGLEFINKELLDKLELKINEKNVDPEKKVEETSDLETTEKIVNKLDIEVDKIKNLVDDKNDEALDSKPINEQADELHAEVMKEVNSSIQEQVKEPSDEELMEQNVDKLIAEVEKNLISIEKKFAEPSIKNNNSDKSNTDTFSESQEPENDNDDEDSSTVSLRSDNSYVSFNLDEEFVAAIRNELQEKLPRAQMSIVESQELRDDEVSAVNSSEGDKKSWDYEDESSENDSNIDIAIRYNIYGTPLSPILEERESNATSESLGDASVASKLSGFSEDVLVVDTKTNRVLLVEGSFDRQDDDRDTSNGDITDDESADCDSNNLGNNLLDIHNKVSGAPMPSPEEESKWQAQFPIQLQDDLMSTSFSTEHDWDSQDDDDKAGEDATEEDDDDSSSSGEFVWKRYDDIPDNEDQQQSKHVDTEGKIEEEAEDEDEDEEEFTPSAWDATLAPHRSALRSPEKTLKAGDLCVNTYCQDELDQKKNVWFKKQRYHCVYEYPKETLVPECQGQATTTWEPTSYADWEEMLEEPKVDVYPINYESNHDDEEFFVSSGNRPFQFQVGDGKYVSQFFPGAAESSNENESEGGNKFERIKQDLKIDTVDGIQCQQQQQQQTQLGELRHTRDRLKLNLPIKNNSESGSNVIINEIEADKSEQDSRINDESDSKTEKTETSTESSISKDDQSIISVIRSPIGSSLENLSREDIKSSGNGESDGEISELEISFSYKEEVPVKSSRRPLVFSTDSLDGKPNDGIEKQDDQSDFIHQKPEATEEQEKKLLVMETKEEIFLKDESKLKPSENDHVIEKNETDVEKFNKSVREPT
ncbi:dentin sialophosphoprotein-like isoform X2 [Microplitis mediator]|uniref:dentin sialophosphoprotein-like isoform X2 n=1 Tax=Microplitis mediator TaxID=375433 RepID=UPI0025554DD9|nr:dentin sialophosphoprotein-like isoform X2 [Microplitis mediator]